MSNEIMMPKLCGEQTMMVTASCGHRIVDVVAGRFLQELKRFLENPATLLAQI